MFAFCRVATSVPSGFARVPAILALWAVTCGGAQPAVIIESVDPTVLFPKGQNLRQLAWLRVENRGAPCHDCRVRVSFSGNQPDTQGLDLAAGVSSNRMLIPDLRAPAELSVEIEDAGGKPLTSHHQGWLPQRHWKVFIVHSSHEDLGYEDYIFRKQRDIANYIDLAGRLNSSGHEVGSYRYTLETLLFMRNYIEERSETEWRLLAEKYVKTDGLPLMGAPSGIHTQWMDYEELARTAYGARREAKDRYGLDLKTFMMVDNPSASWSACQVLANAGFKYLARWGQGARTGSHNDYAATKLPAIFWWVGPDGISKILYAWRSHYTEPFWYGQDYWSLPAGVDAAAQEMSLKLQGIESGKSLGPYPYDALIQPEYYDHEVPHFKPATLAAWNNAYQYPEIRISGPTPFFEYMEQNYAAQLPTLSGELNNFSGDYSTIDPNSQGWKRRAARLLPMAEGLSAIAGALDAGFFYPAHLIDRTYVRMFDYDEHSWPTQPLASEHQIFNAQWVKQREGERALDYAREAVRLGFDALKRSIPNAGGRKLVVFNPLAHERTSIVTAHLENAHLAGTVIEQRETNGDLSFVAEKVPAFGYRVYEVVPGEVTQKPAPDLAVGGATLENSYYKLQFDPQTGAIRSLFDKELKRELVDPHAGQEFNQMIYFHTRSRESAEGDFYSPKGATLQPGKAGPVSASFTARIDDPVTGAAITQTVTLWTRTRRIDIVNRIEHAKAMHSDHYEDRYRDNIFYAFPVDVPGGQARAEYAGGVVRPYKDQLRWGSHDYLNVNHWVDVSNQDFGVTMAPREASAVSFGEIRYSKFSIDYQPANPHLYSFAWSNRMAGLLTLSPEDCNATLHYSFRSHGGSSHTGDWDHDAVTTFGWEVASPLETSVIDTVQRGTLPAGAASFVRLSAPNVELVTLKNSEQPGRGWILRLVETEGRDTDVSVDLGHFDLASAEECDLVENPMRAIPVDGNRLHLRVGKYTYVTIRLLGRAQPPPEVGELRSRAVSDSEIALEWPPAAGTAGYNVFRSEDPKDPPTVYTLVGRAVGNHLTDAGLNLDTTYYYHVASVSRDNRQGQPSKQASAHTSAVNRTPPGPVEDLGIVRQSKDTLVVYWHKAAEPDVARYLIYRSQTKSFPESAQPIADVKPTQFFLQLYRDTGLEPGHTYYYKVLPEDGAGNRQNKSAIAVSATPRYAS